MRRRTPWRAQRIRKRGSHTPQVREANFSAEPGCITGAARQALVPDAVVNHLYSGWRRNREQAPSLIARRLCIRRAVCLDSGWRRRDGWLCYATGATQKMRLATRLISPTRLDARGSSSQEGGSGGRGHRGSRWAVAGRLSLGRRLLCGGLDGWQLTVDDG